MGISTSLGDGWLTCGFSDVSLVAMTVPQIKERSKQAKHIGFASLEKCFQNELFSDLLVVGDGIRVAKNQW